MAPASPSLVAEPEWNAATVLTSEDFGGGFGPLFPTFLEEDLGLLETDDLDGL